MLFDKYSPQGCKIELIESFPCASNEEKNAREGYWIKNTDCINKRIAGRSEREYYCEHKERLAEYKKEWAHKNKQKLAEYRKNYYIANTETKKQYELENK